MDKVVVKKGERDARGRVTGSRCGVLLRGIGLGSGQTGTVSQLGLFTTGYFGFWFGLAIFSIWEDRLGFCALAGLSLRSFKVPLSFD